MGQKHKSTDVGVICLTIFLSIGIIALTFASISAMQNRAWDCSTKLEKE